MPEYIIAYRGGKHPESAEERAKHMEKWQTWVKDLGNVIVNPGTPLTKTKIISSSSVTEGDKANTMSGFSVVRASDIEKAIEVASTCPFLDIGGTLEVAEMMEMKY